MPRDKYDQTIGLVYKQELHSAMAFLNKLPFARWLKEHELIMLAASAQRFKVKQNTLLLAQDQKASAVTFIVSGLVKIVRKVVMLPKQFYHSHPDDKKRNLTIEEAEEMFRVDPLA